MSTTSHPRATSIRSTEATYLLIQGAAGLSWWCVLILSPTVRSWFVAPTAPDTTLYMIAPADLALFVGGSIATATLILRGHPASRPMAWLTAGAVAYAALLAVGLAAVSPPAWIGAGPMIAAALLSLLVARRIQ